MIVSSGAYFFVGFLFWVWYFGIVLVWLLLDWHFGRFWEFGFWAFMLI